MEQSSEESLESEDSEQNFHEGNDYFKMSKNETFLAPSRNMKISDNDIQRESANLVSKDENGLAQNRANLQEVNECKSPKGNERGRAKSVGRGELETKRSVSPKGNERGRSKSVGRGELKTKRSVSMTRTELETKRSSSEREEELTFFTKMTDKERNRFIREKMGLKPKYTFQEKHEDELSRDHMHRKKSRSRSRSREKDCHRSRKRTRDIKERRRHGDQIYAERSEDSRMCEDQRCYGDQSRPQRREQKGYSHFRDHGHAERKKEIPCKYFNDVGSCKYNSGHPDQFGNPKLHICAACYYERGEKRLHSQVGCVVVDGACMYYNNFGDCEYMSGHLSLDGKYARNHICRICFEFGEKRFHPAIECKYKVKKYRKDSPGRERYESDGHRRHDSKHHDEYGHRSHDSKHRNEDDHKSHDSKHHDEYGHRSQDSKHRNEDDHKSHDSKHHDEDGHRSHDSKHHDEDGHRSHDYKHHDEKPCSFFNNNGSCRFASGHYPGSGGSTKQLHICSCCLEFLGEEKYHPAADCNLKKKLSEGRMDLVYGTELPCNSFNSGNCVLKSGHRLLGGTRFLHICKFCFEYRGEQNYHTQEECKLKKELLKEVEYESQSKYVYSKKKEVDRNNGKETRDEKPENKIIRKTVHERSPTRFTEKSGEHFRVDRLALNVTPQDEKTVNSEETRQLKTANEFKVCLIKAKTSRVAEKCAKVSPCKQPTPMEEAINQTKSNIDEADEHETFLHKKDPNTEGHDFGDTNLEKRDFDETEQETSTESDEGKGKGSNLTKTVLKDKEYKTVLKDKEYKTVLKDKEYASGLQSKEKMNSGDACVNDEGKAHDPPLIKRNPFYHNVKSKSNKEERGKKRRKLERCTPQTVISLTDTSERGGNSREMNEKRENPCEEGLLPVDNVLKISNSEVGNEDSEIEMNESEILKKIEHLEKLHMIEVEKLRKARHQTAEVTVCAQEFA